mmetsp:Transcript_41198/g.71335  ORF Transcript_41198/g.71335 Transcript_41198/m.71335 type:complete len:255 (-) Transcript_41198:132-896(-)
MFDAEFTTHIFSVHTQEVLVQTVRLVQFFAKPLVGRLGLAAHAVEGLENAVVSARNEVHTGLVRGAIRDRKVDVFLSKQLQLLLKQLLIESVLQRFVGVVDQQLLETVVGEIFKPKNIQHTNKIGRAEVDRGVRTAAASGRGQGPVDTLYNVTEKGLVNTLAGGVTGKVCLHRSILHEIRLSSGGHLALGEQVADDVWLQAPALGRIFEVQDTVAVNLRRSALAVLFLDKHDVGEMQNTRQYAEHPINLSGIQA